MKILCSTSLLFCVLVFGFFLYGEILVCKSFRSRKVTDGYWSHAAEKAAADRICYLFTAADKTLTV